MEKRSPSGPRESRVVESWADDTRLETLFVELLASVRGGDGAEPGVPGPVGCGPSRCFQSPCKSPGDGAIDVPVPLCATLERT